MNASPLVFLHGWAMTPAVWQPLIARLNSGNAVFAPALPGHGGAPAAASAILQAWTDAIQAALPDDAVVTGWSLGAMLALDLAARYPHKVSRLALIGASPKFVSSADWPCGLPPDTVSSFLSGYVAEPQPTLRRFLALQTLGDSARRGLMPMLEQSQQAHPEGRAQRALAVGLSILAEADLRPSVAQVKQPVQLIHGDGDALMPVAAAQWLAQALPNAGVEIVSGSGHAPLLSRPDRCAELIRALAHD